MMWARATVLVLVAAIVLTMGEAPDDPELRVRVQVVVTARGRLENRIESYIRRELRGVENVEVVEDGGDVELRVVALPLSPRCGYGRGVALSIVILERYKDVSKIVDPRVIVMAAMLGETFSLYYSPSHWLRVGAMRDLKELCTDIVADFDMDWMEVKRKIHEAEVEVLRKFGREKESHGAE